MQSLDGYKIYSDDLVRNKQGVLYFTVQTLPVYSMGENGTKMSGSKRSISASLFML